VYAWCRRTDDIVDKPRKDTTSLRDELADWTERLRLIWQVRLDARTGIHLAYGFSDRGERVT
jgi:phytoene/squalene synthetase